MKIDLDFCKHLASNTNTATLNNVCRDSLREALSYTHDSQGNTIGSGCYEGETIATIYYHELWLRGDADNETDSCAYFIATVEEKQAFGLVYDGIVVRSDDVGFVYLQNTPVAKAKEYVENESLYDELKDDLPCD